MTSEIIILLVIVGISMVFFWREIVPAEVVALGVLLALAVTGLVPRDEVFSGFGSDTVIMILGLLILTAALDRTGVVDIAGRAVLARAGDNPHRLFLIVIVASAFLSAFMSNTATAAFFLPIVLGLARKTGSSPARLLLPLAFASILSSSVSLISTSTNLVVSGLMVGSNLEPMGMFEMAPVGIPIAIAGLAYLYVARKWIPDRFKSADLVGDFGLQAYLSEVIVLPGSKLAGKTMAESRIEELLGLQVLRVIRDAGSAVSGASRFVAPRARTVIREGDLLIVQGSPDNILKIKDAAGVEIKPDVKLGDPDLADEDLALVQAVLLPGSPLIGQSLKRHRFRERYGPQVLGINHLGVNVLNKLSQTPLVLGDMLLLQGRPDDLEKLHQEGIVRVIGPMETLAAKRPRQGHALLAALIFLGALILATFKITTLPVAVMTGAFFVFVTGCIRPHEAYCAIEWKAIILIGCILALGSAMHHTGTARYFASHIVSAMGNAGPFWLLTAFFALSVLLTQPMSNQAAAVVILPVAIQTAIQAGLNPRTFAMMVAVASSCSYLTPLEPACLMVHGPGRYRFADFIKLGFPLTIIIYVLAIFLVPWVWPVR